MLPREILSRLIKEKTLFNHIYILLNMKYTMKNQTKVYQNLVHKLRNETTTIVAVASDRMHKDVYLLAG